MAYDVKKMLNDFQEGFGGWAQTNKEDFEAFGALMGRAHTAGALDVKTKELISLAIGVYAKCDYCIVYHTAQLVELGATEEEMLEAATVAIVFGGGPAMAYTVTLLRDCIAAFSK